MRARCLIPFVAIALAGCTGLRAESGTGAEAGSCVAHQDPVPAPVASTFDPRASLEEVRVDYPQAKLDEGPAGGEGVLTFGPAREGLPPDPLSLRFLQRHFTALGVGETPTVGAPLDLESPTRTFFAYPLRDTGCARIRVTLERGPSGPTSLRRTCERLRKAPPSYAARPLPSTSTGDTEILVRVGVVGGFAGPLFGGYVIDRFGDVYARGTGFRATPSPTCANTSRRSLPPTWNDSPATSRRYETSALERTPPPRCPTSAISWCKPTWAKKVSHSTR